MAPGSTSQTGCSATLTVEGRLASIRSETSHAAARLIVTDEQSAPIVPFFWSELFGNRILVYGRLDPDAPLTGLAGDRADRRFVAATIGTAARRASSAGTCHANFAMNARGCLSNKPRVSKS